MDRRRALRVPMRGVAILGTQLATIENLSASGALFVTSGGSIGDTLRVELKLGLESGWLTARTMRVEHEPHRTRIAVEFYDVTPALAAAITTAIEGAIRAASRRPVLVVDDQRDRRSHLVARLTARGMTPLAPQTPLEAIDLLARSNLHINVALLAPSFGHSTAELHALFADSFPWVTATDISNDVEATVEAAAEAWSSSDTARLATAIA
ncbi:MAG: PilZ domain-containing protein [Kofleriaceae bacterium]